MKKHFFFAAFAAICLTGTVSCSSDETINEENQVSNQAALSILQQDIANLNVQEFGMPIDQRTRSLKSFFRRLWKVVAADAIGGICGAWGGPVGMAVGAATASGTVSVPAVNDKVDVVLGLPTTDITRLSTRASLDSITYTLNSNMDGLIPSNRSSKNGLSGLTFGLDSIGYYHNKAILDLNSTQPDWTTYSTEDLTKELGKKIMTVTGWGTIEDIEKLTQPSGDIVKLNVYLQQLVLNDNCELKDMCEEVKKAYPSYSSQIDILYETIYGLQCTVSENSNTLNYCEKVLDIIDNAKIDNNLRSQLRSGIVVANASSKLWNVSLKE